MVFGRVYPDLCIKDKTTHMVMLIIEFSVLHLVLGMSKLILLVGIMMSMVLRYALYMVNLNACPGPR